MNRKIIALLGLVVMISLSGCATVSVSAEVNDVNTVDRYEMNITTSTTVYALLESSVQEDGYENLEEAFTDDIADASAESVEYNESIDGNDVTISLTITELNVSESDSISIEERDGEIVYTDDSFLDEDFNADETETTESLVLEYELTMPEEVTESNADEVNGNTATWRRTGEDAYRGFVVEARSPTPSDDSVPGFGIPVAILSLLVLVLLGVQKKL